MGNILGAPRELALDRGADLAGDLPDDLGRQDVLRDVGDQGAFDLVDRLVHVDGADRRAEIVVLLAGVGWPAADGADRNGTPACLAARERG